MIDIVRIPRERIPALIGAQGKVKAELEKRTHTRITVREDVEIGGETFDVMAASNVVKAIGRGFAPESAFLLLNEEYDMDIITLSGESEKAVKRLMGRVIGREGRTRKKIEEACGARVSVYGKTVAVIGDHTQIAAAARCIEILLQGKTHGYAYHVMEGMRKKR